MLNLYMFMECVTFISLQYIRYVSYDYKYQVYMNCVEQDYIILFTVFILIATFNVCQL